MENWQLGLFNSAITPYEETDTASVYTAHEASFTNYTRLTLQRQVNAGASRRPRSTARCRRTAWSADQVSHSRC